MNPYERKCIDNYSIKSFADLITMNTQMKSTRNDIQQYITPDVILKYFNAGRINDTDSHSAGANQDIVNKTKTMKRAFKSLQNFSKAIQGNPFYKEKVTYPIYLEHENRNNSHDYDFILLANDLIPKEILDEIKYDDKLTLVFLFIKDMLYPTVPLSEVGVKDKAFSIRSDMARFIEYSKAHNTDPITVMLRLIKIAGENKQKTGDSYSGLVSLVNQKKMNHQSISNKFFKLFGGDRKTGQIKDVNFLLNEIRHIDITKFFDDTSVINKYAHTNTIGASATGPTNTIERQYMAEKTQDYNKILSIVDSLINFNSAKDIMVDVDQAISDKVVKVSKNGEETSIDINYDKIVNSIRNDYFESFLINLIQKLNSIQYTALAKTAAKNIKSLSKKPNVGENVSADIEYYNLEMASAYQELTNIERKGGNPSTQELNRVEQLNNDIRRYENLLNNLQLKLMYQSGDERKSELQDKANKKFKSDLTYKIASVQNELTNVLREIESNLYKTEDRHYGNVLQKTFDEITKSTFDVTSMVQFFKTNGMVHGSVEQLMLSIVDSIHDTISSEAVKTASEKEDETIPDQTEKLFQKYQPELEKSITAAIYQQLFVLYKRLGREYGNKDLIESQKYADLRTEKNPIIRKTITNNNNFKTYILNEQVMLQLYEMLNYADTQKYIAGLIAYPPAKINNPLNIIKYIIKRLGMESNPVFVIGRGSVILSTPDFLSLTGTSVFSKIPFRQMESVCKTDYNKMWNSNQMFKQATKEAYKDTKNEYRELFNKLQAGLKEYQKSYSNLSTEIRKYENIIKKETDDTKISKATAAKEIAEEKLKQAEAAYNLIKTDHKKFQDRFKKDTEEIVGDSSERIGDSQPFGTSSYEPHARKFEDKKGKKVFDDVRDLQKGKQGKQGKQGGHYNKTHNKPNNPNNQNQKRY